MFALLSIHAKVSKQNTNTLYHIGAYLQEQNDALLKVVV